MHLESKTTLIRLTYILFWLLGEVVDSYPIGRYVDVPTARQISRVSLRVERRRKGTAV